MNEYEKNDIELTNEERLLLDLEFEFDESGIPNDALLRAYEVKLLSPEWQKEVEESLFKPGVMDRVRAIRQDYARYEAELEKRKQETLAELFGSSAGGSGSGAASSNLLSYAQRLTLQAASPARLLIHKDTSPENTTAIAYKALRTVQEALSSLRISPETLQSVHPILGRVIPNADSRLSPLTPEERDSALSTFAQALETELERLGLEWTYGRPVIEALDQLAQIASDEKSIADLHRNSSQGEEQ